MESSTVRSRVAFLLSLAIFSIALVGVGTALGVTDPLTSDEPGGEFVVSDQNVTFSNQDQQDTIVQNLSNVTTINIEETNAGQFTVKTDRDQPLTTAECERAIKLARTNETVRQSLADMEAYELTVDPIYKIDDLTTTQINGTVSSVNDSSGVTKINTTDTSYSNHNNSVVVQRDPSYVEDKATIRIRQPNEDGRTSLKYTVSVDLATETVTDITDWEEIREDSTIDFS